MLCNFPVHSNGCTDPSLFANVYWSLKNGLASGKQTPTQQLLFSKFHVKGIEYPGLFCRVVLAKNTAEIRRQKCWESQIPSLCLTTLQPLGVIGVSCSQRKNQFQLSRQKTPGAIFVIFRWRRHVTHKTGHPFQERSMWQRWRLEPMSPPTTTAR